MCLNSIKYKKHISIFMITITKLIIARTAMYLVVQCFPTGTTRSPCAPRCIVKGSARDDVANK